MHVQRSEDHLHESVLSLHLLSSGYRTQAIRFGSRHLYSAIFESFTKIINKIIYTIDWVRLTYSTRELVFIARFKLHNMKLILISWIYNLFLALKVHFFLSKLKSSRIENHTFFPKKISSMFILASMTSCFTLFLKTPNFLSSSFPSHERIIAKHSYSSMIRTCLECMKQEALGQYPILLKTKTKINDLNNWCQLTPKYELLMNHIQKCWMSNSLKLKNL